jgi:D-alanyl-D-alanine carboxypeptidase/D-alanyl-D-alanine-endopeptidase (penicillin-binding protein 4)
MPVFPPRRPNPLRSLLAATLLLAGSLSHAQSRLPADVTAALARAKVPPEALTAVVVDVEGRATPRLSHRAGVPVNPASLMKLVTTYAALDTLGPTYSWTTPVYVEGTARNGTLYGNVYIRGQGDPKLVLERLWLLLRRVQGLDIKTIAGDIVLDRSAFDVAAPDPGEFDGERLRPYNAAPDALLLNYKAVVMTFVPDRTANAAHVSYDPPLAGVQLPTHVPLIETDCGDWRTALRADFSDPARIRFAGRYPASCSEKVWPLAYADPASYATRAVEGMWREMGGQLQGRVREGKVPAGLVPAFELASPALAEVIRDVNKYSNNVMAQQLFLTLSLVQQGVGSHAASREVLQGWWKDRFGSEEVPVLDNGSGLSRSERITAQALARLLQHAWRSPLLPELASSLPITGVDGTLRRMRNGAVGSAHLKTGSLRDVAGVAGYVHAASGKRYVLVAIINHASANTARPAIEALIEWAQKDR